jgi:V/A-type H+-transporting ATPase subunit F
VEFFVIGDEEVVLGFRFAGAEGAAVYSRAETLEAFHRATTQGDVKILILTEQVSAMIEEEVTAWQFGGSYPLVVEVPGIEGHLENRRSLVDAIREAVGVHV